MIDKDAYFDILNLVEDEESIDPGSFLRQLVERYGLAHASYFDIYPGTGALHLRRAHHTYGQDWVDLYHSRALYRHDAVLHEGLRSIVPVDWTSVRKAHPGSEVVFDAARSCGIPQHGLTFPQLTRGRSQAVFSISASLDEREWPAYRRAVLRDIQSLAALFHALMQGPAGAGDEAAKPELTGREAEVLRWSAAGKSYWEISMILGVSERTVRFFMTNARHKLNVVTNTQAVATAILRGLIPPI